MHTLHVSTSSCYYSYTEKKFAVFSRIKTRAEPDTPRCRIVQGAELNAYITCFNLIILLFLYHRREDEKYKEDSSRRTHRLVCSSFLLLLYNELNPLPNDPALP
jgi:hypothetical protein